MAVILDPQAARRQYLAHCMWMAKFDEDYARSAATHYERTWPEVMTGLRDRLDADRSRRKQEVAHA